MPFHLEYAGFSDSRLLEDSCLPEYSYLFSNDPRQSEARSFVSELAESIGSGEGSALLVGGGQLPSLVDVMPATDILMVDRDPYLLEFWEYVHDTSARSTTYGRFLCDLAARLSENDDGDAKDGLWVGMNVLEREFGSRLGFGSQTDYEKLRTHLTGKNITGLLVDISLEDAGEVLRANVEAPVTFANFTNVVEHIFRDKGWEGHLGHYGAPSGSPLGSFVDNILMLPWSDDALVIWSEHLTSNKSDAHFAQGIDAYIDYTQKFQNAA